MASVSNRHSSSIIQTTPEVCGGLPCVGETRIPVWLLEQARRLGVSARELVADYPTLSTSDIESAWAYAHSHAGEIDRQILENEVP